MTKDADARIAAIEQRLAPLEAAQPAKPAQQAQPAQPEGTQVHYPLEACAIELPTDGQLRSLSTIVLRQFPRFAPDLSGRWADMNATEFHNGFRAAFLRIARLNRSDSFDHKRDVRYFSDEAEDWWRAQGQPTDIRWPVFFCAALSAGDVLYTVDPDAVALRTDGMGRRPVAGWKAVLDRGQVRPASPHAAQQLETRPATVTQMAQRSFVETDEFLKS